MLKLPPALARLLPFLRWPRPSAEALRRDFWAGFSVGLVLIPQALAYATLAGMPPHTGLYAALLPAVIGILWGSSPLLAVGPVALTSILTFGTLSPMAAPGSAQWVALAIWLAIYAGIIQFLLGALRLGKVAYLVSQPVVTGFINAAALIIILSQLPQLLGVRLSAADPAASLARLLSPSPAAWMTMVFGAGALLLLLAFKRFLPRWPGILVVTIAGIAASRLVDYGGHGGAIVGALPSGLPGLSMPPAIAWESHQMLWPAALILAVISFTEAMSSCRVLARRQNTPWDENQELIGQGLAKVASGFSGAFPVSGSFSRTALNLYAGATSAWASLIAVACVVLALLFLTGLVSYLPLSVLAAMIMVPVFSLIDVGALRRLFRVSRDDGMVALVTFAVTLAFAPRLHVGVFAGIALTMVSFLYRRTHPRIVEVGRHADGTLRDRSRFALPPLSPDVVAVRMDSALNFLTAASLERAINAACAARPQTRRVLLSASGINDIDASGADMLAALHENLRGKGMELHLSAVKKQVWDVLERAGMIEAIGTGHFFATDREAMAALQDGGAAQNARLDALSEGE